MRILLTGISSFTGHVFARELSKAGHEIVAPLRGKTGAYEGVRARRVERAASSARLVESMPFGSPAFVELLRQEPAFDVLCHHGAEVSNYRSPDFDPIAATRSNTLNLREVLETFSRCGGRAVILTGSVFECDEGKGEGPDLPAFSPYGLSKALTWQTFRHYCGEASMPLGKFVIPNPFGPFEEPRFTAYLVRCWRENRTAEVKTPEYVRDNIHVDLLAGCYRLFVERMGLDRASLARLNPSGYAESQGAFAQRFAEEMRPRLNLPCEVALARQTEFLEPRVRVNTVPAADLVPEWDEDLAWDALGTYYRDDAG